MTDSEFPHSRVTRLTRMIRNQSSSRRAFGAAPIGESAGMTELPERDDFGDYGRWPGRAVLDPTGRRLGEVREIYLDDATDRPEWVLVDLGDDGARYVPLADATVAEDAIK